ncbi:hypothetical protein [Bacillus cihuensis]|uniref:hypothetical protein n=1 Tax=Bacillus cihuensis TaxID=1208599 RepID=UPI0004281EF9|nr:hypothetical protein [Bacillus cihuensis]
MQQKGFFDLFTKWRKNLLVNRLKKETHKEANTIAKHWEMRKFVIVNKSVREDFPDIYNGAFNTESKRVYIHNIPLTTVNFLFNELLKISVDVEGISVEFDQDKSGHNIEFEIYLRQNDSDDRIPSFLDIANTPCSLDVSERFYFELISILESNIS